MGDITAIRPVAGDPIATSWGQEVHDQLEAVQSGSIQITCTGSPPQGSGIVTFPRPYATPPTVLVSCQAFVGATSGSFAMAEPASASAVAIWAWRLTGSSGNPVNVTWQASGKLA